MLAGIDMFLGLGDTGLVVVRTALIEENWLRIGN
jgi:hypothetical protein